MGEAELPGNSLSAVTRKYGVNSNQLFHWRKLMQERALVAVETDEQVVPTSAFHMVDRNQQELTRKYQPS